MKKIILLSIMFISLLFSLTAQISSSELMRKREKEIKEIQKKNLNPEIETSRLASVDSFYQALISKAMERENKPSPDKSKKVLLGETSLSHQGTNGSFISRNTSVEKSANAYATVVGADAYAKMTDKVVQNMATGEMNFSNDPYSYGFKGAITNRYRRQMVDVRITGINTPYSKTISVKPGETVYLNLLPGNYKIRFKGENDGIPGEIQIDVDHEKDFRSDDGKDYSWGANLGNSTSL